MVDEVESSPVRRRMHLRRRTGGFSASGAGNSTRSESLRSSETPEDYEDEDLAEDTPAPPSSPPALVDRVVDSAERDPSLDPRARMNAVAHAGSAAFAKEYRLNLLHRLLMRNIPLDVIAGQMGVSLSTVQKDRAELKKRLREQAKELDINLLIGSQSNLYNEISGMALRLAHSDQTPIPMRLAAMRTSLAANADYTRFLNTAGVFDVLRYRLAEDGGAMSDIQMLMNETKDVLKALMESQSNDFSEFSINDEGDDEVMEL